MLHAGLYAIRLTPTVNRFRVVDGGLRCWFDALRVRGLACPSCIFEFSASLRLMGTCKDRAGRQEVFGKGRGDG
jgi:hypothetical protein